MLIVRNVVLLAILAIICYTDIKRMEIDNEPILIGLAFIIPFSLMGFNDVDIFSSIYGFLLGGVAFAVLTIWGMGGGDVKLMALIGFFVGWRDIATIMVFSFIIGAILGIIYVFVCKKDFKQYIPFGPPIAVATIVVVLFGGLL